MQTRHTIDDLYDHIFKALADLSADRIDVAKANGIANLAQTLINAGKLECKFIDTIGGHGTGFMPKDAAPSRDRLGYINHINRRTG